MPGQPAHRSRDQEFHLPEALCRRRDVLTMTA
jgi:hypothetical protein